MSKLIRDDEIENILAELDHDNDQSINLQEFMKFMLPVEQLKTFTEARDRANAQKKRTGGA